MPNVVHDVQSLAAALKLLSMHKEVEKEPMYFIVVGVFGVDGFAVDAIHDVKGWKKVICTTAKSTPGEIEVDHLVVAHGLVLEMNPEVVGVIIGDFIASARRKLFTSGLRNMLLGHPFEGAHLILIFKKHHCGIELENHLLGVIMSEGHQGDKSLLFTNLLCFTKVVRLRL
jgi:hypothetical protein